MKAVIMAGGEGSRLRPLTCNIPKPLVKLCGKPVSEYILDLLAENGCDEAVFTLRYKGKEIENHFKSGKYKGITLDFSYEDTPLGTAGAVKKAALAAGLDKEEEILVISGDAMCDFDLSALLVYHKAKKAAATILTKSVEDPREYGCVLSSEGFVTGFSEKPSYMGAVSDMANTGIYVISKKALELIPDNVMWDFSKNVFPQMLAENIPLAAFEGAGYWCDIGDIPSYKKCQRDILFGMVRCEFDNRCDDIADSEGIKLNLPCFIGENVSIGAGTVIESGSVIESNTNIGKNCKLRDCVIGGGVFLADKVKCSGAIICENSVMEQGAAAYENSVLGSGSVMERDSVLEPNVKIWDNKRITFGTMHRENLKYGENTPKEISEKGIEGETNTDITPGFMTVLGSACEAVFDGKVIVSCGGGNAATVLKACFCAGFSGSGGKITDCGISSLPALIHLSRVIKADGVVNIDVTASSRISILNRGGLPLTRVQERKLESALNRGDYRNAEWDGFGEIKTFKNAALLYSTALEEASDFKCRYNVALNCNNPIITAAAVMPLKRISNKKGELLTININREGSKAELFVSDNEKADHTRLITIVGLDLIQKGHDVAVPLEFPSVMEEAAKSAGRDVKRFYQCSNDNSDKEARILAGDQPFLFDGLLLALNALQIITESYVGLGQYLKTLPDLRSENRFLCINCPPQRIIGKLAKAQSSYSEGVFLGQQGSRVLLRSNRKGDGLYMYAESYSQETAKSLCDEVEEAVKRLSDKF